MRVSAGQICVQKHFFAILVLLFMTSILIPLHLVSMHQKLQSGKDPHASKAKVDDMPTSWRPESFQEPRSHFIQDHPLETVLSRDLPLEYKPWFLPWMRMENPKLEEPHLLRWAQDLILEDRVCRRRYPQLESAHWELLLCSEQFVGSRFFVLSNGTYHSHRNCGRTELRKWFDNAMEANIERILDFETLVFLITSEGGHFQHWVPDVVPKLGMLKRLHALDLKSRNVSVLVHKIVHPNIRYMFDRAMGGRSADLVVEHDMEHKTRFNAKSLLLPCYGPVLHPLMFDDARSVFEIPQVPLFDRNLILVVGRGSDSWNPGRIFLNEESFIQKLTAELGAFDQKAQVVKFLASQHSLDETIDLWSRALVVVGPHGGALFNMFFSGKGTSIIELFHPSLYEKVGGRIVVWLLSAALGQHYWRFSCNIDARMNLECDIDYLVRRVIDEFVAVAISNVSYQALESYMPKEVQITTTVPGKSEREAPSSLLLQIFVIISIAVTTLLVRHLRRKK